MHAGSIITKDGRPYVWSREGTVFAFLRANMKPAVAEDGTPCEEAVFTGWELQELCHTTAIGTRISGIRLQLPGGRLYDGNEHLAGYEIKWIRREKPDGTKEPAYRLRRRLGEA